MFTVLADAFKKNKNKLEFHLDNTNLFKTISGVVGVKPYKIEIIVKYTFFYFYIL